MKNILLSMAAVASMLHTGGDVIPAESLIADTAPGSTWNYEFQLYGLAIWIDGDATEE